MSKQKTLETFNATVKSAVEHAVIEADVSIDPQGIAIIWDAAIGWRMFPVTSYTPPETLGFLPWPGSPAPAFAIVTRDGTVTKGPAYEELL